MDKLYLLQSSNHVQGKNVFFFLFEHIQSEHSLILFTKLSEHP